MTSIKGNEDLFGMAYAEVERLLEAVKAFVAMHHFEAKDWDHKSKYGKIRKEFVELL